MSSSWICKICSVRYDESVGEFYRRKNQPDRDGFFEVYICNDCIDMVKGQPFKHKKKIKKLRRKT